MFKSVPGRTWFAGGGKCIPAGPGKPNKGAGSTVRMRQRAAARRVKILVAKLGLDGHDRGALVLCRAFRDAGMEVIYSGLFATPERVAQIAEDEDVDAVAMSLLNGAHGTLFPRVVAELRRKGMRDVLVVGGGVIPEVDHKDLAKAGVDRVFGPGTPLPSIIDHVTAGVSRIRKAAR